MAHKPAGVGKDASANPVSLSGKHLLVTIPINLARAGFVIQNNDPADSVQVVFDDGNGGAQSVYVLKPIGDSINMLAMPHSGRILIYGDNTSTSVAGREW